MAKCVNCTTTLSMHNKGERCFLHLALQTDLQEYVSNREVKVVGLERWSAGQTAKRHLRLPYVRKLAKQQVVPWDASLEEIEVCDSDGFNTLKDELVQINYLNSFLKDGVQMDEAISSFSYDEATCVETHFPESNFLTKWHIATKGGEYRRFRSPIDEVSE